MHKFLVTFQLESFYEDSTYNKTEISKVEFEAENLDHLFEILDCVDEIDRINDQKVISADIKSDPLEVNIEHVVIHESVGVELYRDDDYIG